MMSAAVFPIEVEVFIWRTTTGYRVQFALAAAHRRLITPVKLPDVFDSTDAAHQAAMDSAKSYRYLLAEAPLEAGSCTIQYTGMMHVE